MQNSPLAFYNRGHGTSKIFYWIRQQRAYHDLKQSHLSILTFIVSDGIMMDDSLVFHSTGKGQITFLAVNQLKSYILLNFHSDNAMTWFRSSACRGTILKLKWICAPPLQRTFKMAFHSSSNGHNNKRQSFPVIDNIWQSSGHPTFTCQFPARKTRVNFWETYSCRCMKHVVIFPYFYWSIAWRFSMWK